MYQRSPGPHLVLVEAGFVLRGLEASLDPPAAPGTRISSRTGLLGRLGGAVERQLRILAQ